VRLEAGSCVHPPSGVRHREPGHSDDVERLEIVLPANFTTEDVASVNGWWDKHLPHATGITPRLRPRRPVTEES
jgi:hypothetical protein